MEAMLARVTDPGSYQAFQHFITDAPWSADRVWRHLRSVLPEREGRSVYVPCLTEALGDLLDAHEQAFTHFGGHTQEHLYDRPRTVCVPRGADGVRWNATFKAFADFWGFEPRLCRAYRAQTKGKVESGVKYFKRNFLAGRRFRDDLDFNEPWHEWTATVADVRVHGTTHERPIDRFARERAARSVWSSPATRSSWSPTKSRRSTSRVTSRMAASCPWSAATVLPALSQTCSILKRHIRRPRQARADVDRFGSTYGYDHCQRSFKFPPPAVIENSPTPG